MIRIMLFLLVVSILTPEKLSYPDSDWKQVTTTWDQGQGFTFAYDPAFVSSFGRGGVRLSAAPVENVMYWHGGGLYRNLAPFGYIEISAKLPKGRGLWPALFLFNYDTQREIDIFEMIDPECKNLQFTVHDMHNAAQVNHEYIGGVDLSRAFHRYGLRWAADKLVFYLDGQKTWETDQYIPSENMDLYLVLSAGGWAGNPDETTPNPAYMDINYLKVWQK